jgi:hypothetical protein
MNEKDFFCINVKCYEGFKSAERPISFQWGTKQINVEEIIDQWQGEDHNYFKIMDSNKNIYIIRRDIETDGWQIVYWNSH